MTPHAPFLTDEPDSLVADAFGHADYAEALHSVVTDEKPPLTVGLFGPWGVGKSSIIGALQKKLEGSSTAFVYFDAWRYEDDSLRRQFLLSVAGDLASDGRLGKYDIAKELREVEYDTQEVEESLGWSWRRLLRMLAIGAIFGAIALIAALLGAFHALLQGNFGKKLLFAFATTVSATIAAALSQAISVDAVTMTRRSLTDPDRFARKFAELLGALEPARLVIAIDNLDRTSPEKAVEILGTIKTYLEPTVSPEAYPRSEARPTVEKQIVFLIAVDDEALRRHLVAQERVRGDRFDAVAASRYVEEYLTKFFGARLPIRAILGDDMRGYVASYMRPLVEMRGLDEGEERDLVTVVNAGLRSNPRGVKQFHNDLELRLRLLEERERTPEGSRPGISPPISGQAAMVAKLALMEREWPAAFARLQADPLIFERWMADARTDGLVDWSPPRQDRRSEERVEEDADPEALADRRRLATFLRATARIDSTRMRALLSLKQAAIEVSVPSYAEFRDALLADERERVSELLDAASVEERGRLLAEVPTILADELERGYLDAARSIVDVVCSSKGFGEHEETRREVIRTAAENPALRPQLADLDPVAVLRSGSLLDLADRRRLFEPFLGRYHNPERGDEERVSIAGALASYLPDFSARQRSDLNRAIGGEMSGEFDLYLPFVEADDSLLAPAALDSALATLAAASGEGSRPDGPRPLHRGPAAPVALAGIGMRRGAGAEQAGRMLEIVDAVFLVDVGSAEDLDGDLGSLHELAMSVRQPLEDQFGTIATSIRERWNEVPEPLYKKVLEFAGDILARSPESIAVEVAATIRARMFESPAHAFAVLGELEPIPAAFRDPFVETLATFATSAEFWEPALRELGRIEPEGLSPHLIGAFEGLFRADLVEAVRQLLEHYGDRLAAAGEPFEAAAISVFSDRVAGGNPGPPDLLTHLLGILGVEARDRLAERYAVALWGTYGEPTRQVLEALSGTGKGLTLLAAHHAVARFADLAPPPQPPLFLVSACVGELPPLDQEGFAETMATLIGSYPGQLQTWVAALMRTQGLPADPAAVVCGALFVVEPNLIEPNLRVEVLRAIWHLRVRSNTRVARRLRQRLEELERGENEIERELAGLVRDWMHNPG